MKTPTLLLASALLLPQMPRGLTADEPQPGPDSVNQPRKLKTKATQKIEVNYLLFLPKDYAADARKKWPLMLFLHGAGERGSNLWLVPKHGPPKVVRTKPDFPFILVSPQCPAGRRWDNQVLLALLDEIIADYKVDTNRVYLTGLSMGGYGTWSLGLACPERFAALVPICGGGDAITAMLPDTRRTQALKTLPIWAFHGAKDPVVPLAESERMVNAVKAIGGNVKLTVYPEAQHDSWTETYNNPQLYDWLLGHARRRAPTGK
jgi:predicted peptidase